MAGIAATRLAHSAGTIIRALAEAIIASPITAATTSSFGQATTAAARAEYAAIAFGAGVTAASAERAVCANTAADQLQS